MQKVAVFNLNHKEDSLDGVLKSLKGEVLKEFEKVCPTDMSFQRVKKDMHDKFDETLEKLTHEMRYK